MDQQHGTDGILESCYPYPDYCPKRSIQRMQNLKIDLIPSDIIPFQASSQPNSASHYLHLQNQLYQRHLYEYGKNHSSNSLQDQEAHQPHQSW